MRWDLIQKIKETSKAFKNGEENPHIGLNLTIKEELDSGILTVEDIFDIMCVLALE